nr:hypothetical protein [uncultured Campylobacter sp.]
MHQAWVRLKPYRREQGADEREILYLRYRQAKFYLWNHSERAFKFRFELARDRLREYFVAR